MPLLINVEGIILSIKDDVKELIRLAESIGYNIKEIFIQKRERPTPYYLGKGKIEEIKNFVKENGIEIAIVNDALRPSQWFNLEKTLGINVYDRIRLILEIFSDRAKRKEAKLQVKLAKLRYEKPFVRELFHRIKKGERPGFLAGGEYVIADYYEMIKKQMRKIKEELRKIEEERKIRRALRRERGFYLVSIAGYTNAGKSSLLNYLTGEKVVVEERVFSSLSPNTSKMKGKRAIPLLFTDTVGFIRDLPHWIIDAFHSTLEEIALADVILLLVDGSEEINEIMEKISISLREIYALKDDANIIIALNKIDLISKEETMRKVEKIEKEIKKKCVPISAKTGENVDILLEEIYNAIPKPLEMEITVPIQYLDSFISWLYNNAEIYTFDFDGVAKIRLKCSERAKNKIIGKCKKLGGVVYEI